MSTKGSIILTKDNEHWYEELIEMDNENPRVYIEIRRENITSMDKDVDDLIIGIKGDSELAQMIKLMRYIEKDKDNESL